MLKKMMLLAMAVGVLAAFAVPAVASASEWTKEGKALTADASAEFTGNLKFITGVGSYECTTHAPVTLKKGSSTGTVNKFEITTSTCVGGGVLACKLVNDETTGAPWTMHVNAAGTAIEITNVVIHNTFDANCPIPSLTLTLPNVTATPDKTGAISSVALSGGGITDILGMELPITVSGTLAATPAGVYGIK